MIRLLAARVLAEQGYRVLTAADGVEALELLERESVAVLLSDLRMPRMNGHELALRARQRWPWLSMLFMTGHPDAAMTADLPGPLIMKPFVVHHLVAAIGAAVEAQR